MSAGLRGHEVAAAYAILNSDYKKSSGDGWEFCQHIGMTRNLEQTLQDLATEHGGEQVAYVRALSFVIPNENAMDSIASDWRREAKEAGGKTHFDPVIAAMESDFDDDDEFDDDDDDDDDDEYDDEDDDDDDDDSQSTHRSDFARHVRVHLPVPGSMVVGPEEFADFVEEDEVARAEGWDS